MLLWPLRWIKEREHNGTLNCKRLLNRPKGSRIKQERNKMSLDEKSKMWSVGYDKMYVKYNLL